MYMDHIMQLTMIINGGFPCIELRDIPKSFQNPNASLFLTLQRPCSFFGRKKKKSKSFSFFH